MSDPVYSIHRSAPAGGSPSTYQEALLRERYDGQVKTLRALGDETDIHWTIWRRWALELGLKNPPDQQPVKERTRKTLVAVPEEPAEAIEEPEEAPEFKEDAAAIAADIESHEPEEVAEEEIVVEPAPAPTPLPSRPEPRGSGRLGFEDRRFLGQYMERLPYSWNSDERGRWLRAFIAALDLIVEQWPPAEGAP